MATQNQGDGNPIPITHQPDVELVVRWLSQLTQVAFFDDVTMEIGMTDEMTRMKDIYISAPATPPHSKSGFPSPDTVSTLRSSDAVLASCEDKTEGVKRGNDKVSREMMLERMQVGMTVQETMDVNDERNAEPVVGLQGNNGGGEFGLQIQDHAVELALDAISYGGAAFSEESPTTPVQQRGLQNVLYPPPRRPPCCLGMTAAHIYGFERPEYRTRAFLEELDVAIADVIHSQGCPQALSPETRPTEVFPPPVPGRPVPDPGKPRPPPIRGLWRRVIEILSIPSPAAPTADPVKGQDTAKDSPIRPRRRLRRVGRFNEEKGDIVEGQSRRSSVL